ILAVYYGASRAGVVPVPLHTRLAPAEWAFIVADAGAAPVVAAAGFAPAVDSIREGLVEQCAVIGSPALGWRSFDEEVAAQSDGPVGRTVTPEMALYQMYTSGTTGLPKGAILTQRAITTNIAQLHTAFSVY